MEIFGVSGSNRPFKAPIYDNSPMNAGPSTSKVTLKKTLQSIKSNDKNVFKNDPPSEVGQNNYMIDNNYENDQNEYGEPLEQNIHRD